MLDLIGVDIYKMMKSSFIRIVFVLSAISAGFMLLYAQRIASGDVDIRSTGIPSFFADSQIFTLLGCVVIGVFLCNDFDYKIIENAISSGHSRQEIVLSKMITLIILISILSIPYILIILYSVISHPTIAVFMPTAFLTILSIATNGSSMFDILLLLILTILIYAAQLSIGIFVMFLVKKPVIVIAVSYVILLFLGPVLSLSNFTKDIMTYSPYGINVTQIMTNLNIYNMMMSIIICLVYIAVFTFLSILSFRKCDIK